MSYKILFTPEFEKEIKRLSRKYPSLRQDYQELVHNLSANPLQGQSLGNHCFKIRLSIKSKASGKSGGARVITCVKVVLETIILVFIYDKSEKVTITDAELKARLRKYLS